MVELKKRIRELEHKTKYLERQLANRIQISDAFRALSESLPLGVLIEDNSDRVIYANPAFRRLFGIPAKKKLLKLNRTSLHKLLVSEIDKPDGFIKRTQEIAAKQNVVLNEIYNFRNGGQFERDYKPLLDEKSLKGHCWFYHLKENRTQPGETVPQTEEKFRILAEQSPNMIFLNLEGKVIYANPKCVEYTGYTIEELLSPDFSFLSLIAPEYLETVKNRFRQHMNGEDVPPYEYEILKKNGERLNTIITTKLIEYNNSKAILGTVTDITQQKQTEKALRQSEERFHSLIQSAPDGIIVSDDAGKITMWNKGAADIFGYTAEEVMGKSIQMLMPKNYRRRHQKGMRQFRSTGKSRVVGSMADLEGLTKDGTVFPLELSISSWQLKNQRFFAAIVRNISHRKKAETELLLSRKRYQSLFDDSPVPLWEENFSELYVYLEKLKKKGIRNFRKYFDRHPGELKKCIKKLKVLDVNQAALKFNNARTKEELITNLPKTFSNKSYDGFKEEIIALAQGQLEFETETEIITLTGETKYAHLSLKIDSDFPATHRALLATTDITDRIRAAEAFTSLATSYADLYGKSFFEQVSRHIAQKMNLDYVFIGEFAESDFGVRVLGGYDHGRPMEEITYSLINTPCRNVVERNISVHPENVQSLFPEDELLAKLEVEAYIGSPLIAKDGETLGIMVGMHTRPLDNTEIITQYFKIFVERIVAEMQKSKAEKAQRESEKKYRLLFEGNPHPIWVYDLKSLSFLAVNEAAIHHYGYSRDEFLSMTIKDIHLPEEIPAFLTSIEQVSTGLDKAGIWTHLKKDGSRIFVEITSHTLTWSGKRAEVVLANDVTGRKIAQAALEENQRQLSTLLSNLPGIAYRCRNDENWTMEFISSGCVKLTGYQPEELVGNAVKSYSDLIHPEDRKPVWESVQTALEQQKPFQLLYRIITAEGTEKWVWEKGQGVTGESGDLLALEGFITDITESKKAEEALHKSRERLLKAQKVSRMGFLEIDLRTNQIHWSDSVYNILGVEPVGSPQTLESTMALVHPDDLEIVSRSLENAIAGIAPHNLDHRLLKANGDVIWVQAQAELERTDAGDPKTLLGTILDITDRKQAEESLRESEKRYRHLVSNARDIIYRTDASGKFLYMNPMGIKISGYSEEEILSLTYLDLIHPNYRKQAKAFFLRQFVDRTPNIYFEMPILTKKGEEIWIGQNVQMIIEGDRIVGFQALSRDITERKRLEEQLRQAQKMEAVGQLAGGVAHDFNNLLTVINGYCEMLLFRDLPDKLRPSVEQIKKAGERATRLTSQLLAFSRKQVIQPKILNLNNLILDQANMLGRLLGEDIEINLDLAQDLGSVKVDPGQMEQVIMNISVNSRDAMPYGGKLVIRTGNTEFDDKLSKEYPGASAGAYVLLTISDTGVGMDEETCSHIFEPFYTTKGREKGTGLGLATVYGIIKQNMGAIYVESEQKKGTTFTILLPMVKDAGERGKTSGIDQKQLQGSETILLVEDDAGVLELTRFTLADYGYTVLPAENAEKALKIYSKNKGKIDLLLTDVIMPGMSGKELAQNLRTKNPQLKVIYFSGYTDDAIAHHGVLEESVEFIQKPYAHTKLAKKVRQLLDKKVPGTGD